MYLFFIFIIEKKTNISNFVKFFFSFFEIYEKAIRLFNFKHY